MTICSSATRYLYGKSVEHRSSFASKRTARVTAVNFMECCSKGSIVLRVVEGSEHRTHFSGLRSFLWLPLEKIADVEYSSRGRQLWPKIVKPKGS